jgi:hypothetical protein
VIEEMKTLLLQLNYYMCIEWPQYNPQRCRNIVSQFFQKASVDSSDEERLMEIGPDVFFLSSSSLLYLFS